MIRQILLEQKRTNRLLQGLLLFGIAVGVGAVEVADGGATTVASTGTACGAGRGVAR